VKEKEAVCRVKEAKRLSVIEETIEKQMTQGKAAPILGLSERQMGEWSKKLPEKAQLE